MDILYLSIKDTHIVEPLKIHICEGGRDARILARKVYINKASLTPFLWG